MKSHQQDNDTKVGVRISKETGGAYADVKEVIKSELGRIREEWANKSNSDGVIRNTDSKPKRQRQSSQIRPRSNTFQRIVN